ncbi:MAG: hypothetical protein OEV42_03435 [Deltaproteobacteria bacterium]|nr:hypothetical protein [Deltaproteobacteria bacterium]
MSKILKQKKFMFIFIVIAVAGYGIYWSNKTYPVLIVIPNEFEGYITIIEDSENYDSYNVRAWENYDTFEYDVGDDSILSVESIRHFLKWPHNIGVGRERVEPLVYYKDKKKLKWPVFGDLIQTSETEYHFWVGKRVNFNSPL